MSILTPEQIADMASKGLSPDVDHVPQVFLETKCNDEVIGGFMLTHVNPEHENEAYGLIDFGTGKPRMSIIFLNKLQPYYPDVGYNVEVNVSFTPTYPVSVYAEAARKKGRITTNANELQKADWDLKLMKARGNFTSIIRNDDGPAFLPFPN